MLATWQADQAFRAQLKQKRPPSHACAGAIATSGMFGQYLLATFGTDDPGSLTEAQMNGGESLMKATLSAIARHHTPSATTYDSLAWDNGVHEPLTEALAACRISSDIDALDLNLRPAGSIPEEWLASPEGDDEIATWLAFVLVRALRLCDQRAERDL